MVDQINLKTGQKPETMKPQIIFDNKLQSVNADRHFVAHENVAVGIFGFEMQNSLELKIKNEILNKS